MATTYAGVNLNKLYPYAQTVKDLADKGQLVVNASAGPAGSTAYAEGTIWVHTGTGAYICVDQAGGTWVEITAIP